MGTNAPTRRRAYTGIVLAATLALSGCGLGKALSDASISAIQASGFAGPVTLTDDEIANSDPNQPHWSETWTWEGEEE